MSFVIQREVYGVKSLNILATTASFTNITTTIVTLLHNMVGRFLFNDAFSMPQKYVTGKVDSFFFRAPPMPQLNS